MNNIITKGTETLAKHMIPINEDCCIVGKIKGVSSSLIQFTKVFDTGETKLLYAIPRYNGRTQSVKTEHLPIIDSFARFYRVGDYNSQGSEGFELHAENAGKASFVWFADYKEDQTPEDPYTPKYYDSYNFYCFDGTTIDGGWSAINYTTSLFPGALKNKTKTNVSSEVIINTSVSDTTYYPSEDVAPGYVTRKTSRTGLNPSYYQLSFYTGYSGGEGYTGLVKTFLLPRGIYEKSATSFCMPVPRGDQKNKESWIISEHPYDVPTQKFYVQISEVFDVSSLKFTGNAYVAAGNTGSYYLRFDGNSQGLLGEVAKYYVMKEDVFDIANPIRIDKAPVWIKAYDIQYYDNTAPQYYYIKDQTTYSMRNVSRKSGFYLFKGATANQPKYDHKQWILTLSSVSVGTTAITCYDNSTSSCMEESFNSDGTHFLTGNTGTGGLVPGTTILANYYTMSVNSTSISVLNVKNYVSFPKTAISWYKWNGLSWVAASVGDTISTVAAGDIWLTKSRLSNIRTVTPFTLT